MLKVVGASLEQTRLTQFLLIVVILIAIFAIFFYEATPSTSDGCYAATAYWSGQTGFRVEFWGQNNDPEEIKLHAARAYYRPLHKNTGWATLEIETNKNYNGSVQARAAGLLEGSLSWQLIYWHWQSTVGAICMTREKFCADIKNILEENYKMVKAFANRYENDDPFWYQVNLFYIQLEGILEGWELAKKRSRSHVESITFADILWLNHVNDVRDLELFLGGEKPHTYNPSNPPSDLAVLKYSPESNTKFFVAHQTAGLYSEMLGVMKRYTFPYRSSASKDSKVVAGARLEFTSYPGAIHSQDDFYTIHGSSRLLVVGSRLKNHNPDLWRHVHLTTILMGARITAANRLSESGKEWTEIASRYNSGTGSKEWLVMDHKTTEPTLLLVEQIPGSTNTTDITSHWKSKGYWISSGIPHTPELLELTGYTNQPSGQEQVLYAEPILSLLTENMDDVTNTHRLQNLLTHPMLVKKFRSDLQQELIENIGVENGSVGILQGRPLKSKMLSSLEISSEEAHKVPTVPNGIIDMKLAYDMQEFGAIAGPLYYVDKEVSLLPFQWSKTKSSKANFHYGQPDLWNFELTHPCFVW